jgi:hypothetical protein
MARATPTVTTSAVPKATQRPVLTITGYIALIVWTTGSRRLSGVTLVGGLARWGAGEGRLVGSY